MNYCQNCGVKLNQNENFCHNCGMRIEKDTNFKGDFSSNAKSKFVAGLLGILLGFLGIHNFYLGYNAKGIAQLLLFVFGFIPVSFIWALVEAILIFTGKINTDSSGIPLSNNI